MKTLREAAKAVKDALGNAEWGTPEHAQAIFARLIDQHYPALKAALDETPEAETPRSEVDELAERLLISMVGTPQAFEMHDQQLAVVAFKTAEAFLLERNIRRAEAGV